MNTAKDFQYFSISRRSLHKSAADFQNAKGAHLLERTEAYFDWKQSRTDSGVWPYHRSLDGMTKPTVGIRNDAGVAREGINFASQDYLGLNTHPAVHEAVASALRDFGPHSAGSPCLLGNTALSLALERELADAWQMEHVTLFPTGWAAGFGAIQGLVRPYDHIVLDKLAHACVQTGAYASTKQVRRFEHNSHEDVRRHLQEIRATDTENGILVVTEGLFSMDADVPDIREMQQICREYNAVLLVDVAHDFGALGDHGLGSVEIQQMLGQVDLVMGSFSKTFTSNGGFVASRSAAVKQYMKVYASPHIFSNALSPLQAAAVRAALKIVRSDEGKERRQNLMRVVNTLRQSLADNGIVCLGIPSAIVPTPIGSEAIARVVSRLLFERGIFINLVEYPTVAAGKARLRLQVMATHTEEQAKVAAAEITKAVEDAQQIVKDLDMPMMQK